VSHKGSDRLKKFIAHPVPINVSGPVHCHKDAEIYIGPAWIDFVEASKRIGIKTLRSIELKKDQAVIIEANVPHQGKILEGGMIYTTERNLYDAEVRGRMEDFL